MDFDLHIHSEYSFDSSMTIERIAQRASAVGLAGVAITDHDCFEAFRDVKRLVDGKVMIVMGMEVASDVGDVIGFFLHEAISSRRFDQVVDEIHQQQGLVVLPHPFKRAAAISEEVLRRVDAIEIFNARGQSMALEDSNQQAQALAYSKGLPGVAGSDAHFYWEIGRGRTVLPSVNSTEQLKAAILNSSNQRFKGKRSSPFVEVLSQWTKWRKTGDSETGRMLPKRSYHIAKWYGTRLARGLRHASGSGAVGKKLIE